MEFSTDNAEYVIIEGMMGSLKTYVCDAAYWETTDPSDTLEYLHWLFSKKYPSEQEPNDRWIFEKYLIVPVPPGMSGAEGVEALLITIGAIIGVRAIREGKAVYNLLKTQGINRRDFLKKSGEIGLEGALATNLISAALSGRLGKFQEMARKLDEMQKEKHAKAISGPPAASAITAIILEKEVAPRIKKETGKKPRICIAIDEEKTGVSAEQLAEYAKNKKKAETLAEGYRNYLEQNFGIKGEVLHRLRHINASKNEEIFEINLWK